jgi:hypothetical protein
MWLSAFFDNRLRIHAKDLSWLGKSLKPVGTFAVLKVALPSRCNTART